MGTDIGTDMGRDIGTDRHRDRYGHKHRQTVTHPHPHPEALCVGVCVCLGGGGSGSCTVAESAGRDHVQWPSRPHTHTHTHTHTARTHAHRRSRRSGPRAGSRLGRWYRIETPEGARGRRPRLIWRERAVMLPQYTRWRAGRETAPYKERQAGDRRHKTRPVGLNDAVFDGFYSLNQCQTLCL